MLQTKKKSGKCVQWEEEVKYACVIQLCPAELVESACSVLVHLEAEWQSISPGRDDESICTFFCLTGINKLLVYFMYILEVYVFGLSICNANA